MGDDLINLLTGIAFDPTQKINDIPIMGSVEYERQVVTWNTTAGEYPSECLHQLFENEVRRAPNSVALVHGDRTMSYAELDRRSSQVAHGLHCLGVQPETIVGICVDPSFELMVGVLGILKAGAAYLPIDPTHPQDRVDFMLREMQTRASCLRSSFCCQGSLQSRRRCFRSILIGATYGVAMTLLRPC